MSELLGWLLRHLHLLTDRCYTGPLPDPSVDVCECVGGDRWLLPKNKIEVGLSLEKETSL